MHDRRRYLDIPLLFGLTVCFFGYAEQVRAAPVCFSGDNALIGVAAEGDAFSVKVENDGIKAVYDNCHVGDVISVPSTLETTVEDVCDFNKSIVQLPHPDSDRNGVPTVVLCVIAEKSGSDD